MPAWGEGGHATRLYLSRPPRPPPQLLPFFLSRSLCALCVCCVRCVPLSLGDLSTRSPVLRPHLQLGPGTAGQARKINNKAIPLRQALPHLHHDYSRRAASPQVGRRRACELGAQGRRRALRSQQRLQLGRRGAGGAGLQARVQERVQSVHHLLRQLRRAGPAAKLRKHFVLWHGLCWNSR